MTYDEYIAKKKKEKLTYDDYLARNNISKVNNNTEKESSNKWFKADLFNDGYQFGDLSKTIGSTAGDIGVDITKGIMNIGEGIGDLITYGSAQIQDWRGNDERANELRQNAQKNVIDDIFSPVDNYLDKGSVLGGKSDNIVEGIGYVIGMTAISIASGGAGAGLGMSETAAATLGSTITTFTSAMGNGMTEAYQDGAEDNEAWLYGFISGVGEAGSELMFGGLGKASSAIGFSKGVGAIDDKIIGSLTKPIKNKMVKALTQYGLKAAGEGAEEVASAFVSALGKKLTYMKEKDFSKIWKDEHWAEQFWMGTLTSALVQAPSGARSVARGTDYITNRTANEQKVFDTLMENKTNEIKTQKTLDNMINDQRTKLKELYGRELTQEEINTIKETVNEVEKAGRLDIQNTKLDYKEQVKLQEEIENDLLEGNLSPDTIRDILGEDTDISKDSLLQKSLYEDAQKYEDYKFEATDNEKVNILLQSAADSGLNNNIRTRKMVESISKLVEDTDRQFKFVNQEQLKEKGYNENANGLVDKETGEILLNVNSNKVMDAVIGHETTHLFDSKVEGEYTQEYKDLQSSVIDFLKTNGTYETKVKEIMDTYTRAGVELSQEQVIEELTADTIGDNLFGENAEEFIKHLTTNRNVFQKIYDYIKKAIRNIKGYRTEEAQKLQSLKDAFDRVYKTLDTKTDSDTETKYSIGGEKAIENIKNKPFYIEAKNNLENAKQLKKEGKTNKELFKKTGWYQDQAGDWKFEFSDKDMELKKTNFAINKEYKLSEVLEHDKLFYFYPELSKYTVIFENKNGSSFSRKGNIISITSSKINDRTELNGTLIHEIQHAIQKIENNAHGTTTMKGLIRYYNTLGEIEAADTKQRYLNDINNEKNALLPETAKENPTHQRVKDGNLLVKMANAVYNYFHGGEKNVYKNKTNLEKDYDKNRTLVDERGRISYSISQDNQGRTLSKEQQEYFKDSKALNPNGELETVYHGTNKAGFTVFNRNFNYYTNNKEVAQSYTGGTEMVDTKRLESVSDAKSWLKGINEELYINDNNVYDNDGEEVLSYSNEEELLKNLKRDIQKEIGNTEAGGVYEGYVNITKPVIIDAKNEKWSMIDIDHILIDGIDNTEQFLKDYGSSVWREKGKLRTSTNDIVIAIQDAIEDGKIDADGIIIKNVYDEGGYGNTVPTEVGTDYITFNSNQFKAADNKTPTSNQDIRYSISEDTENGVEQLENYRKRKSEGYQKLAKEFGRGASFWEANLDELDTDSIKRFLKRDDGVRQKYLKDNNIEVEKVYDPIHYRALMSENESVQNFIKNNDITVQKLANNENLKNEYFNLVEKAYQEKYNTSLEDAQQITKQWKDFFERQKDFNNTIWALLRFENDFDNIKSGKTQEIDTIATTKNEQKILDNSKEFEQYIDSFVNLLSEEKPKLTSEQLTELAQDTFGTTNNFNIGAYMTPDGKLLKFEYGGYRSDHRDINAIGYTMDEFINAGNIRMKPEGNGFELTLEPTQEQYKTLEKYINSLNGEIYVEIDIGKNKYDGADYKKGTPTSKIISDLQYYFKNGEFPKQSELAQFRYSLTKGETDQYWKKQIKNSEESSFNLDSEVGNYETKTVEDVLNETPEEKQKSMKDKAKKYISRSRTNFINNIVENFGTSKIANTNTLNNITEQIREDIQNNEKLTKEQKDNYFNELYNNLVKIDTQFYDEYKSVKDNIRNTKLYISDNIRSDITDFGDFRKSNMNNIIMTNDSSNISVDAYYKELSDMNPELFPTDIVNPTEQLLRIADVVKDIKKVETNVAAYNDANLGKDYRYWARETFDKDLDKFVNDIKMAERYNNESTTQDKIGMTKDLVKMAYSQLPDARRKYEKANAKEVLTKEDRVQVDRLLNNEITIQDIPEGLNKEGIIRLATAKSEYDALQKSIKEYQLQIKQNRIEQAKNDVGSLDLWKDKKIGFKYSRETPIRNIYDVAPKGVADNILNKYFRPYIETNEKTVVDETNRYYDKIRDLELNDNKKYKISFNDGTIKTNKKVSESALVQLLGENKITVEQVRQAGADVHKIENAVKEFRNLYNEMFEKINESMLDNGYAPVEFRKDYFPHFTEQTTDTLLGKAAKLLGIDITNREELPTDISGQTYQFKPGRTWFGNLLQRTTDVTDYDAKKGFEKYVKGAMDLIYHTGDIQNLRALSSAIRGSYNDTEIKNQVLEINENNMLTDLEKAEEIQRIYDTAKDKSHLSKFTEWLDNYINLLAGKKAINDRGAEKELNRNVYQTMTDIESRIAANAIGGNVGVALTNFAPLAQAWGEVKTHNLINGIWQTMKASLKNDNSFASESQFITRRRGVDALTETTLEKITAPINNVLEFADKFTSEVIVRARYNQNLQQGMNTEQALEEADRYTAGLMADRGRGALPTQFSNKNPIAKMINMFQVEVNNQWSYYLKDLPRNLQEKANNNKAKVIADTAMAYTKIMVGSYLVNELLGALRGKSTRVLPDPIYIVKELIKGLSDDDDDNDDEAIIETLTEVAGNVPFVSLPATLLADSLGLDVGDIGRIPISGSIPNISDMVSNLMDSNKTAGQKAKNIADELIDTVGSSLALPYGGSQLKKTVKGLSLYNNKIPGSYTEKGDLRYTVEDSVGSKIQAGLFGAWANPYAQDYIDSGYKTIKKENIDEMVGLDMNSTEYRKLKQELSNAGSTSDKNGYKQYTDDNENVYWYDSDKDIVYDKNYNKTTLNADDLIKVSKTEEKLNYINSLDLTPSQKNLLANNLNKNSKKTIDIQEYSNYDSYEEYKYARDYPNKYAVISQICSYDDFKQYNQRINEILKEYKEISEGATSKEKQKISKQKKAEIQSYIDSLDLDIPQKMMLEKAAGGYSINNYKGYIQDYLDSTNLTQSEKYNIWEELFN